LSLKENSISAISKAPPAYLVAQGTLLDPATFNTYAQQVPKTLAPFGGNFLVTGARRKLSKVIRRSSR